MSRVKKTDSCWLWRGARDGGGYGICSDGPRRKSKAHRVAWELYRGPIPAGVFVRHVCDNRLCVNPDHLILGDHWDNMRDMVDRGQSPHGEKHWCSKVTERAVRAMRDEYATGHTSIRKLAEKHGISRMTVHAILNRQTWRHIR